MLENQRQGLGIGGRLVFHIGKIAVSALAVGGNKVLLLERTRMSNVAAAHGKAALLFNGDGFTGSAPAQNQSSR